MSLLNTEAGVTDNVSPTFTQGMMQLWGLIGSHSRKILLVLVAAILIGLVIPPIAMVLFSSVRSTQNALPFEATGFTITNILTVFSSKITYRLLLNTLGYAIGTLVISLGLATLFAWFLERTNVPFRRTMFVLVLAPMGMPMIIISMAWILLANPTNGLFNVVLRMIFGLDCAGPINVYSMIGMIVVTGLSIVPMVYIMISGAFSSSCIRALPLVVIV